MSSLHLLDLPLDCETSVAFVAHQLRNTGLHAVRSFEIDSACGSLATGICSHDPGSPCMCQLVVLQVSDSCPAPVSLILHTYHNQTEIFIDGAEADARQGIITIWL